MGSVSCQLWIANAFASIALVCVVGCGDSGTPNGSDAGGGTSGGGQGGSASGNGGTSGNGGASGSGSSGSGGRQDAGDVDRDAGDADAAIGDASTPLAGACAADATFPESGERTVTVEGIERTYLLHVPTDYDRAALALVLTFHGWNSNAMAMQDRSRMNDTADREGFAVVYPQGIGDSFNAGGDCCGDALDMNIDEGAFVRAILDDVAAVLCLDRRRVYSTGMSNGGFLSYRFACEMTDVIAAVAPVAAVVRVPTCEPSRPIPVLHFHGTSDAFVPDEGRSYVSPPVPSVQDTIDSWLQHNGCTGDPAVTYEQGDARCEAWTTCDADAEVELCLITGGGHTWPGGMPAPNLGVTTTDISASDWMWEFFKRHALP